MAKNKYMKEYKAYDDRKGWLPFSGHLIASYTHKTKDAELDEFLFITSHGEFLLEISDIHLDEDVSSHFYYITKTMYGIMWYIEPSYQAIFKKIGITSF